MFFPVGQGYPAQRQAEEAKRICGNCVVRGECLDWAMSTGQEHGVWGGTSETERRAMKFASRRRVLVAQSDTAKSPG